MRGHQNAKTQEQTRDNELAATFQERSINAEAWLQYHPLPSSTLDNYFSGGSLSLGVVMRTIV